MPRPAVGPGAALDPDGVRLGGSFFGTVLSYDSDLGLGMVELNWGEESAPLRFQCMAIDDGTRDIQVGTSVLAKVGAGPLGTLEAIWISRVASRS